MAETDTDDGLGIAEAENQMPEDASMANVDAVETTCPSIILNIGMFFDGTYANRTNVAIGFDMRRNGESTEGQGSRDMNYSNIVHLHDHYKHKDHNRYADCGNVEEAFERHYIEGIGSTGGMEDSRTGGAMGFGETGIDTRVAGGIQQTRHMIGIYEAKGKLEQVYIDVFGWSRGAAAARYYANYITYLTSIGDLPDICQIRFLGIYDTVPGTAIASAPDLNEDGFHSNMNFNVSTSMSGRIVHLTAINEIRENFRLMRAHPGGDEIALPGSHGDLGGSTFDHDTTRSYDLSNRAVVERLQAEGVLDADFTPIARPPDVYMAPPGLMKQLYGNNQIQPIVSKPGLYKVSLQIMHKKARESQVPMVGLSGQYNPPPAVSGIVGRAMGVGVGAEGRATDAQIAAARPYIHPSSWARADIGPGSGNIGVLVNNAENDAVREVDFNYPENACPTMRPFLA